MSEIGQVYDHFRVDGQIGHGGMGVVYAATDTRLNRPVALKVISQQFATDSSAVARFLREADVLSRLDSPHIITIYDAGEAHGSPYIASQFVPGGDLGSLIRQRGALPSDLAVRICSQIADALSDAHAAGIVHRDVKPSNVLLRDPDSPEPHAYLCDFGIAQSEDPDGLTRPGQITGSWGYLAPERIEGKQATPASDIYAMGCLLWACLAGGQPPYTGSDYSVGEAHLSAPIPQLPDSVPDHAHLNQVLATALAKDPTERYASAADLKAALLGEAPAAVPVSGAFESDHTTQRAAPTAPPAAAAVAPAAAGSETGGGRPTAAAPAMSGAPTAPADPTKNSSSRATWPLLLVAGLVVLALIIGGAFWALTRGDDKEEPNAGDDTTSADSSSDGSESPSESESESTGTTLSAEDRPSEPDSNGDGKTDVVFEVPFQTYALVSDGSSFSAPERLDDRTIYVGDLDGNGGTDFMTGSTIPDSLSEQEYVVTYDDGRLARSTFKLPDRKGPDFSNYTLSVADMDGDGLKDLVFIERASGDSPEGKIVVAQGSKEGFGELKTWHDGYVGDSGAQWRLGDFDADGKTDFALASMVGDSARRRQLEVALSTGDGLKPLKDATKLSQSFQITTGDPDGDGDDDLIIVQKNASGIALKVRSLDGTRFGPAQFWLNGEKTPPIGAVVLGDYNGDGNDDVMMKPTLRGAKDKHRFLVSLSDGSKFSAPQEWVSFDCEDNCITDDLLTALGRQATILP